MQWSGANLWRVSRISPAKCLYVLTVGCGSRSQLDSRSSSPLRNRPCRTIRSYSSRIRRWVSENSAGRISRLARLCARGRQAKQFPGRVDCIFAESTHRQRAHRASAKSPSCLRVASVGLLLCCRQSFHQTESFRAGVRALADDTARTALAIQPTHIPKPVQADTCGDAHATVCGNSDSGCTATPLR